VQSKKQSWFEAVVNVLIGYSVAVLANILIFPHFGINVKTETNFYIGFVFTIISLVRSYTLRRIFNKLNNRKRGK
jgi:hypothetical protein